MPKVKTTGELREMLVQAANQVMAGEMELDRANALHKIAKNISESLYSETKIAMFHKTTEQPVANFGELYLGDPSNKEA